MKISDFIRKHEVLDYIVHMAIFAAAFSIIGYYAPKIYMNYFDKTEYYKVKLPVKTEHKIYHACDFVDVYFEREALIPIKGASVIALTLINEKGFRERVHSEERQMVAEPGKSTVITHWSIPCDIKHYGKYFYEGVLMYPIDGTTRTYHFYTDKFEVATDSALLIK